MNSDHCTKEGVQEGDNEKGGGSLSGPRLQEQEGLAPALLP